MSNSYASLAERLRAAYATGPVPPPREMLEPGDVDGAYAVQSINTRYWVDKGRRIIGRKVGLTAVAVQKQLGVDQPDFGVLFDDMLIEDGGILADGRILQPKAEAEVALVLGRDLDMPDASFEDVAAATDHAVAAIEIVDSRIADWKITFADTVADNASSAFFVLGRERRKLDGLDLENCAMIMTVNGEPVSKGIGSACLGHPLNAAAWLARTLAKRGEPLRAGDIVMTGALGPMVALSAGARVHAEIAGLGAVGFSLGDSRS